MMNEELEQFEQRLSRQPLRQVPAGWREEILAAADAESASRPSREFTFAATYFCRSLNPQRSTLNRFMASSQSLGRAGGGLDFDSGGEFFQRATQSPAVAERSAPPSPEAIVELRQQQRMLAELIGPHDMSDADRSKSFAPQPRSERMGMMAA